jgi:pyruvate,water dikinase
VICTLSWSLLKNTVGAIAFAGPVIGGYRMETGAEVVRRFRGRAYFDLTLMQWVLYDALGVTPAQVVQSIGGHQPEIPVPGDPSKGPEGRRRLKASLRLLRKIWTVERDLARVMSKREDWIREVRKLEGAELTTPELMAMYEKLEARMDAMDMTIGVANSAEGPWEMALESILKPLFGDQARPMMGKLLAGTGSVTSAEHGYAIFRLAAAARHDDVARRWLESAAPGTGWVSLPQGSAFRAALAAFLEEFGHRAVYEADYLNPRWAEDPTYILDQVRFLLANPQAPGHRDAAERLREEAEAAARQKAGWRAPIVFWIVRKLQRAMAVRERAKSELAALAMGSKRLSLSIGRRMANAGHLNEAQEIFFLSAVDIQCWLEGFWSGAGAHELASDRARQREAWLAQEAPPDVITEEANGRVTAIPVASGRQGETWSGIGAAPGRARGPARIIRHPGEGHTLQAGEVLVAPSTDPGWTPLFLRASAIVMASGGYLSHGAIVAREYGIPAVVNLPGILEDLRPGDRIVVDGDAGRVVRE